MTTRGIRRFLTRSNTPGKKRSVADILSYAYLGLTVVVMFGPVLWLAVSSFKTPAALAEFPPSLLPRAQVTVPVDGYDEELPLFVVTFDDGTTDEMAREKRVGLESTMVDPDHPETTLVVATDQLERITEIHFEWANYTDPLRRFEFMTFFTNSVVVTVTATIFTLLVNSMAAFALSKYRFRGRDLSFGAILATLMVPLSVVLVPVFWITHALGLQNSLWGLIIPPIATPTGVFLLRQYMITIPDDLLAVARVDGATEWQVYTHVILPLSKPALAVLAIFSIMWRWNDFLWPLIIISESEHFTLQLGLAVFQGENISAWNYILAMTVVTLLPITLVFAFLQRFITQGIASTGVKG